MIRRQPTEAASSRALGRAWAISASISRTSSLSRLARCRNVECYRRRSPDLRSGSRSAVSIRIFSRLALRSCMTFPARTKAKTQSLGAVPATVGCSAGRTPGAKLDLADGKCEQTRKRERKRTSKREEFFGPFYLRNGAEPPTRWGPIHRPVVPPVGPLTAPLVPARAAHFSAKLGRQHPSLMKRWQPPSGEAGTFPAALAAFIRWNTGVPAGLWKTNDE